MTGLVLDPTADGLGNVMQETTGPATTSYLYGPGGLPVEQVTPAGTALFYHHDQLGSTRVLTDANGTLQGTYSYDPYGNVTSAAGAPNPLRYAGQYTDPETGLVYLRARYYDPSTGQFLTRDPVTAITQAPYSYVDDDPLNNTDPSGLCTLGLFGKHCHIAHAIGTALDVGSTVLAGAALVADATGVGAPVGLILGGASAGLSVASAGVHCAFGTAKECAVSTAVAALSVVTVGLASPLGEEAGVAEHLSKPVIRGIQLGADLIGLGAGVLTNAVYPFGPGESGSQQAGCWSFGANSQAARSGAALAAASSADFYSALMY